MSDPARKLLTTTAVFVIIVTAAAAVMKGPRWSLGFLLGSAWSMANFALTVGLLEMAILKRPRKNLYAVLFLKFPALYLAGFAVLVWRIVPIASILAGLLISAVIVSIAKLWPSITRHPNYPTS